MLIKVIIDEDNRIIREDNGQIVGNRFDLITYDFISNDDKFIKMYYGFFLDNTFYELCQLTSCSHECLSKKNPNCRYSPKGNSTEGFYYCDGEGEKHEPLL